MHHPSSSSPPGWLTPSHCLSTGPLGSARGAGMDADGLDYCSSRGSDYLVVTRRENNRAWEMSKSRRK